MPEPVDVGANDAVTTMLNDRGFAVRGVFVGGCVERGIGSSFRAMAHTHTDIDDEWTAWICVRSARRVLTAGGQPTRLVLHETAHVIAPKSGHGSPAFIRALAAVGLKTDAYSRAGRTRRATKGR